MDVAIPVASQRASSYFKHRRLPIPSNVSWQKCSHIYGDCNNGCTGCKVAGAPGGGMVEDRVSTSSFAHACTKVDKSHMCQHHTKTQYTTRIATAYTFEKKGSIFYS